MDSGFWEVMTQRTAQMLCTDVGDYQREGSRDSSAEGAKMNLLQSSTDRIFK